MTFVSVIFLIMWLVGGIIYWRVDQKQRWIVLLCLSLFFIFNLNSNFSIAVLLSLFATYFSGRLIELAKKQAKKKIVFIFGILINLGLLLYFKYAGFSANLLSTLLPNFFSVPSWVNKIVLPIGISFYVLQSISYLADVYSKKIKAQTHFGYFSVYHLFFAKFLSGPIERATDFIPQLKNTTYSETQIVAGLQLFLLGAFKKMIIADNLRPMISEISSNLADYRGLSLVLLIFAIGWQIYADFSGYTDMARGIAKTFGIELVNNFNYPYRATSVRDFWRRWHLSLSNWLRDYLYIPLGGSRNGLGRTILNTWIVFVLCGLWHGAAWNFVLWGAFHALFLSLERVLGPLFKKYFSFPAIIGGLYSFSVISFSWILFSFTSIKDIAYILLNFSIGISNFILPNYWFATFMQIFSTNLLEMGIAIGAIIAVLIIEYLPKKYVEKFRELVLPEIIWLILAILTVLFIMIFRNIDLQEFIYVRF